jgi:hypothetical protein
MIQHTWKIIVRNIYERHFLLKLVCCFSEGICNIFFALASFFFFLRLRSGLGFGFLAGNNYSVVNYC